MKPVQNANEWENFCHNMVLLRQTHGYSLLRMAFVLRISPVKLRAVERGEWMPKWDIRILFRIRKKFGVQASELFADRLTVEAAERTEQKSNRPQPIRRKGG